jgi:hypothetical protein
VRLSLPGFALAAMHALLFNERSVPSRPSGREVLTADSEKCKQAVRQTAGKARNLGLRKASK